MKGKNKSVITEPTQKSIWRQLGQVLVDCKLADSSQFRERGFFDEAPLFSKTLQVDFIKDMKKRDELIARGALDYLASVEKNARVPSRSFFAAITFLSLDTSPLVPHIYVCNGWIYRRFFVRGEPRGMEPKRRLQSELKSLLKLSVPIRCISWKT